MHGPAGKSTRVGRFDSAHVTSPWYSVGVLRQLGLVAMGATLLAAPARAYDDQLLIGLDAGYALVLVDNDLPRHAPQLGLTLSLGLNDAWSVNGRIAHAVHIGDPVLHASVGAAEVVYSLDVLQWVPFFGVGTSAILTARDGGLGMDWALQAVVGLDFLASREWVVGLDIRMFILPLALNALSVDPAYMTVGLRLSRVIEL